MPRGGSGRGQGRKPSWNAGRTKAVKLPELLMPEIVEFARMLDAIADKDRDESDEITPIAAEEAVDILFDELVDLKILNRAAQKLIMLRNEAIERRIINNRDAVAVSPLPATEQSHQLDDLLPINETKAVDQETNSLDATREKSLTLDQAAALEKLKQFIQTPRQKYFRLTGFAGTGKSFLTVQLMKWLLNQRINFVGGSPTNKAVKNLKKLAVEAEVSIEAHTVAQLLGQQPELNEDTGKEEFISKGTDSIGGYTVALIDEFSMISKSNFKDINQAVWHTPTKVIFVGDAAQLPPVGESEPVIATHEYINHEATLSTVVRYDGEIARVAEAIRSDRTYNKSLYPFVTTADLTITCLSRDEWLETAIAFFKSEEDRANPDHVRFLVWRNQTAASLNDYVRSKLWGDEVPDYVPGDRLIAKIPVFRPNPGVKGKNKWQIIMNNSEECEVVGEAKLQTSKINNWQYWEVPAKTDDGLKLDLRILTPESESDRTQLMQELKERKRWRQYYDTLKSFDNVPYSYCITTRQLPRAQGDVACN